MSQLLKHYWLDRDNGAWATYTPLGLMMPNIEGLEVIYSIVDENDIPFMLSTCPDDYKVQQVVPGIQVLTQQEWDDEISAFDTRQQAKRYNLLREIRKPILNATDWFVTRDLEKGVAIDSDFKLWRQELRDIPTQNPFPTGLPTIPTSIQNNIEAMEIITPLYERWNEILQISMINDPLSPVTN
jgi:hypothetical protein